MKNSKNKNNLEKEKNNFITKKRKESIDADIQNNKESLNLKVNKCDEDTLNYHSDQEKNSSTNKNCIGELHKKKVLIN